MVVSFSIGSLVNALPGQGNVSERRRLILKEQRGLVKKKRGNGSLSAVIEREFAVVHLDKEKLFLRVAVGQEGRAVVTAGVKLTH